MPTTKKSTLWELFMTKIKDIVFIILFLATAIGWLSSALSKKNDYKNALENNTKAVIELKQQIKELNDYNKNQAELNGKFIQYMDMDSKK
jgi:hypothetical protein